MFLRGSALRQSYDDHLGGPQPGDRPRSRASTPEANQPSPLIEPAEPIPTRARTSAFGRLRHWPWSLARAGGAVRRPGTFIIPFAGCRQGTILAPRAARLPSAGSVAHGHATFWLRAAATSCRGEMNDRDEP